MFYSECIALFLNYSFSLVSIVYGDDACLIPVRHRFWVWIVCWFWYNEWPQLCYHRTNRYLSALVSASSFRCSFLRSPSLHAPVYGCVVSVGVAVSVRDRDVRFVRWIFRVACGVFNWRAWWFGVALIVALLAGWCWFAAWSAAAAELLLSCSLFDSLLLLSNS